LARKLRIFVEDTPQHILLRGINNKTIFNDKTDYHTFLFLLAEISKKIDIEIHSYVLMPTYFEFLATPLNQAGISKFMQSLGQQYVLYFNKKYSRKGTLWDGRYRASLIEKNYLFDTMRYIESLPKKEKLVDEVTNYLYSSIHKNLLNKKDPIISHHQQYKKLGYTDEERLTRYSQIFYAKIDKKKENFIVTCLEKQHVTGSPTFIEKLEKLIGITLKQKPRGRPKKNKNQGNRKMYKKLVVLDKNNHKDLRVKAMSDLNFAKGTAFIPVVANEVTSVGSSFPVVFSTGKQPSLITLVSLGGESLAINPQGKWLSSYVPSFLRKYPFSLSSTQENPNQKIILIDEESDLVSTSEGNPLFTEESEQSPTLENAVKFLTFHENQTVITQNIVQAIVESGILEEREISVGEGEEKQVLVNGFSVIDREKLNALSDDILADWVRKGVMNMIEAHIQSLEHIETLFKLAQQRQN